MGLVQVESSEDKAEHSMTVEGVEITWDERMAQISRLYGQIVIDYVHMFFEERFYVGFAGSSC
ncbi:hypothetical protein GX408_11605 [bacterium]|nr:hypothetical protein [bacterium]